MTRARRRRASGERVDEPDDTDGAASPVPPKWRSGGDHPLRDELILNGGGYPLQRLTSAEAIPEVGGGTAPQVAACANFVNERKVCLLVEG